MYILYMDIISLLIMFIYSPGDWLCRCDGDVAGECVGECDGECSGGEFGME